MASFQLHEIENRLSHIESKELKGENIVTKQHRNVLGQINKNVDNVTKADLSRKAKNVANQKLGLRTQNSNVLKPSNKTEKPTQIDKFSLYTSSVLPHQKSSNAFSFKIHEDSQEEVQDADETDKVEQRKKEFGNEVYDQFCSFEHGQPKKKCKLNFKMSWNESVLTQCKEDLNNNSILRRYLCEKESCSVDLQHGNNYKLANLPPTFGKSKVCKDDVEEPMSLEKSILSPMSVDLSQASSQTPQKIYTDNSLMLAEDYRDDIYQYLLKCEKRIRPKPNYMRKQPDINADMRSVLVDWLIEVAEEYKMSHETLHLSVNYIDRFLSQMSVVRSKLQLLGTAALFVAAKYEEIYPPEVGEFVYITDDTYTKKQVLKMETLILKVLNFDLNIPTVHNMICHVSVSCRSPVDITYMAQYLSELALVSGDPFLAFTPSLIACGAIALSRHCLEYNFIWPFDHEKNTGYSLASLVEVASCLYEVHSKVETSAQKAAYNKYKHNSWRNISSTEPSMFVVEN